MEVSKTPAPSQERKELENVLELTPVALAILEGPKHVFTFANGTFQSLFKLPKDFVGRTTAELFPGADQQGFLDLMDQTLTTGKSFVGHATPFEQTRPGEILESCGLPRKTTAA
jgi:hypothetical protein